MSLQHNHRNLLGALIPMYILLCGGSFLLGPVTIPFLLGYEVSFNLDSVIIIFLSSILIAGGLIMMKEIFKVMNKCEVCKK